MFMYHKESRSDTQGGKEVRQSLKSLWELHSTDDKFKQYFGDESQKELQDILAADKAKDEPPSKAVTGGQVGKRAAVAQEVEPKKAQGAKRSKT